MRVERLRELVRRASERYDLRMIDTTRESITSDHILEVVKIKGDDTANYSMISISGFECLQNGDAEIENLVFARAASAKATLNENLK